MSLEQNSSTASAAAASAGGPSIATDLVPTQVRNRSRRKPKKSSQPSAKTETEGDQSQKQGAIKATDEGGVKDATVNQEKEGKASNQRSRRRNRNKKKPQERTAADPGKVQISSDGDNKSPREPQAKGSNSKRGAKKKPRNRKRYPWRRLVPNGAVDPITLDPIVGLEYPPFALYAAPPYESIPIWPIPDKNDPSKGTLKEPNQEGSKIGLGKRSSHEDLDDLNRRRLAEQWGSKVLKDSKVGGQSQTPQLEADLVGKTGTTASGNERHVNLYDGRALAYYIVSQLQFIDPLNRRDLTREELLGLDSYLRRHGFADAAKVVEAYDAKGITLSSAGAAANTAQGRAEILQQTARNLLESLFGGSNFAPPIANAAPAMTPLDSSSLLQAQYAALQAQEQQAAARPSAAPFGRPQHPSSFLASGDDYGYGVIDDDEDLAMRAGSRPTVSDGGLNPNAPSFSLGGGNPYYSARHIVEAAGGGMVSSSTSFPALSSTTGAAASAERSSASSRNEGPATSSKAAKSKTLSRITKAIRKTNPDERQKQWEAREEARRKAMMANLSFGTNPASLASTPAASCAPTSTQNDAVSQGKLERNRNLAEALGVKPATMRQSSLNQGWARPVGADGRVALDEYGAELNAAIYPESLVLAAKEQMTLLLKVEKKWKAFLADDSAASLPLNPMDRPSRTLVHEYAEFWNLRTESFDAEPKRYIHCVKLLNTCTPSPLLSTIVRSGRVQQDHATQQTSGQPTTSSVSTASVNRFEIGERPKLQLQPRTLPLPEDALPPPEPEYDLEAEIQARQREREEKERQQRLKQERERQALQAAFDSSDDESVAREEDSWGDAQQVPLYNESDEEE